MMDKLIVFDIDDTISATAAMHQTVFTESLIELGVQNIDTNYGAYLHHTDSYIAKKVYEEDRKQAFSTAILTTFESLLLEKLKRFSIQEIKGATKSIHTLKTLPEVGIAFATGALRKTALYKLQELNIDIAPNQLVASNTIEEREGIVSQAIVQAESFYKVKQFNTIISVGDGLWDLKTAENLSINFVGVGEKNEKVLKENGAAVVLKDLTNFVEVVHQF